MGTGFLRAAAVSIGLLGVVSPRGSEAQTAWDGAQWRIGAANWRIESYRGRTGLLLEDGTAWLDGLELENGVIEFDMSVGQELGFHGVAFRAVDEENFEHVYLRPFVSGQPDASQYTPVFNGVSGWQIYTGPRFASAVDIRMDQWIHVELRVRGDRAVAYVDGQPLTFPALQRRPTVGAVGLTSAGAPARFANVTVSPGDPEIEIGGNVAAESATSGLVTTWRVSETFAEARLDSLRTVPPDLAEGLAWTEVEIGVRGIADLARAKKPEGGENTVFAAVTLHSSVSRPARVRFGFSDRVHVYLNGRPIYRADDGWRTRDYKFLGTVGLHDELVLPLESGENSLWFAVGESFGGWGITMQLVDRDGVTVVEGGPGLEPGCTPRPRGPGER